MYEIVFMRTGSINELEIWRVGILLWKIVYNKVMETDAQFQGNWGLARSSCDKWKRSSKKFRLAFSRSNIFSKCKLSHDYTENSIHVFAWIYSLIFLEYRIYDEAWHDYTSGSKSFIHLIRCKAEMWVLIEDHISFMLRIKIDMWLDICIHLYLILNNIQNN